jgi:hypothetical protein
MPSWKKERCYQALIIGALCYFHAQPLVAVDAGVLADSGEAFLNSLGINTHVSQGYDPVAYLAPLRFLGVRNIRDSERNLSALVLLHNGAGVQVDLLGDNPESLLSVAKALAKSGALLAIEGPNEPNNWQVSYLGKRGGGNESWLPVAQLQRDLYQAVKNDPDLKDYPVFHVSEGGAETDNVGLQFLVVPREANTLMPESAKFADYANVHNYVAGLHIGHVDNQAWQAADPVLNKSWDSLYKEYGLTWRHSFRGYSNSDLENLPRVTTETGWDAPTVADEHLQGAILVNTYLAQFKRRWSYTFIYELGEGEGGGGNQGVFHADWSPKLAATYIHNLTTVLRAGRQVSAPQKLYYRILDLPETGHDLLLQKRQGVFDLMIWGERVSGSSDLTIELASAPDSVTVYDVTKGTSPIYRSSGETKIPVTISDHALIVEVVSAGTR